MITPEQIRAARALLRLEQVDLARRAKVSVTTVRRLEARGGADRVAASTIDEIRQVLEIAGVEFIADGVRCQPKRQHDPEVLYRDLHAIAERSAALLADQASLSDSDLYDDQGLPA
jgi:transcriptional regulator with XRE-family HTH domain